MSQTDIVTTDQLKSELSDFYKTFNKFRAQNCKAEDATALNEMIIVMRSLTCHIETAYENCAVLKKLGDRLGKVLLVCGDKSSGAVNGWETYISSNWKACSKVGQKAARVAIKKANNVVFLYDPETDQVTDVTEILKNSEEFIDFS